MGIDNNIKSVKMQVYITEKMDNSLDGLCELMGMGKNELIRYAIGNMVAGYNTGISMVKEQAEKAMAKGLEDGTLKLEE